MNNQSVPYPLRLKEEIMQSIKKSAEENGRSINKEIEFALKLYLRAYKADIK